MPFTIQSTRRAAFDEVQRGIGEDMSAFRARKGVLDQDREREGKAIRAVMPCAGTIVKLHVRGSGTVVHDGDLLAEIVCSGEQLEAELMLPERGLALVLLDQAVKLLYDAFPYERYGVQYGTNDASALRGIHHDRRNEPGSLVKQHTPLASVIEDLVLIWTASTAEDWKNWIVAIPLQ